MPALTAMAIGALALSSAVSAKTLLSKPPKPPAPPAPIAPPKLPDAGAEMSKQIMRARQSAQYNTSGRTSTILTGSRGITDAPASQPKTLLGQ